MNPVNLHTRLHSLIKASRNTYLLSHMKYETTVMGHPEKFLFPDFAFNFLGLSTALNWCHEHAWHQCCSMISLLYLQPLWKLRLYIFCNINEGEDTLTTQTSDNFSNSRFRIFPRMVKSKNTNVRMRVRDPSRRLQSPIFRYRNGHTKRRLRLETCNRECSLCGSR